MDNLDEISRKIEKIQGLLETKKNKMENLISYFKDILIPLAGILLALMGFLANKDANRRQDIEANQSREQKYLEYFLSNYSDSSPTKQAAAFALLKYLNPKVGADLAYSLSANTDLSREAWRELIRLGNIKLNFGVANFYRVVIYYHKNNKAEAEKIAKQLKEYGFSGQIDSEEKIAKFWDNYGWGKGNEIRYNPKTDLMAMKYLYRFIDVTNPELQFFENPVDDEKWPNMIPIHLPPKK